MSKKQTPLKPIDPQIQALADEHHSSKEAVLEIFQELQDQRGGLGEGTLNDVARALRIPAHSAYGIATFYSMLSLHNRKNGVIRICNGPVCWLCGSAEIYQGLQAETKNHPDWTVEQSSCLGLCDRSPAGLVNDEQAGPISLQKIGELISGFPSQPTNYSIPRPGEVRVMMANAGNIDPDSLESALKFGAYQALKVALERTPEQVVSEVEDSGLTGRGGAGFPVGRKWRFVLQATRTPKYIICNADESEPLIFKDRVLMDTNPHQILEGMTIAGYATGANEAFIYIRGEYVPQAQRLVNAIHQAEQAGYLGNNILGKDFSFHIHVHKGAGAYICGEETALIESLEGKRGEPRLRPPFPPTAGFHNMPTLVNNVESYAAVPAIINHGANWYRSLSTWKTPGTKLYMLLGHINRPGLFEAPFGLTLRQIIDDFAGGMRVGSKFQFALTGGAAGTIVPESLLDIPIDYSSAAQGVSLGAGAFLICDQTVSIVAFLRNLLNFFAYESCGKCTPCRAGTHVSLEILTRMAEGRGYAGDIDELRALAENMQDASFCGLGQSVPIPMKSALTHFGADFQSPQVG
jgi:NADH:ubiquinone oxidoreductase subunit F (NADH-binding)/NADH:ubiquinone oxidoreductase subunit E